MVDSETGGAWAAVIGGGTMGAGIAQVLLEAGCEVVLVEADAAAAGRARAASSAGCAAGRTPTPADVEARVGRLRTVTALDGPLDVDLVVEAIPEIPAAKRDLLAAAEKVTPPGRCWPATPARCRSPTWPAPSSGRSGSSACTSSTRCRCRRSSSSSSARARRPTPSTTPAVGRPAGQGEHRGPRLAGLRHQPPRRLPRPGGDPHAGGGRRHRRRHRPGHGARLQAPHGPAAAHRPRRPRHPPGHRRTPRGHARPPLRAAGPAAGKVAAGDLGKKTGRGFYEW